MNRIWVLGDQYFSCAVSCSLFFDVLDYKVTPNQKKKKLSDTPRQQKKSLNTQKIN